MPPHCACRLLLSRALFGGLQTIRPTRLFRHRTRLSIAARYSTVFRPILALRSRPAIEEWRAEAGAAQGASALKDEVPGANNSDKPWYLQVEPPRHPTLLHEPPPLPDVPEEAPRLVKALVKFAAVELGLDQLSLLDLRKLDPPPALGPELLMLFGTVRSERHLHVSADRLVRWLRSHGVSPSADGLLGRNQLKTKMRRRARKAKLLGGAGLPHNPDDGISTGWICVNLGTLGWADMEVAVVDEQGHASGFGVPRSGQTVVVQLLTESKRAELNLENLWSALLRRSLARSQAIRGPGMADPSSSGTNLGPRTLSAPSNHRSFSTARNRADDAPQRLRDAAQDPSDANAEILDVATRQLNPDTWAAINKILTSDIKVEPRPLEQLQARLSMLSQEDFALLQAPGSHGEPSLLESLDGALMAKLPSAEAWGWRLWLWTAVGGGTSNLQDLQLLVAALQLASFEVRREQHLQLLSAICSRAGDSEGNVRQQSVLAMQVIDTMYERGLQVLEHDVMVTVIESLVRCGARGPEADRLLAMFELLLMQAELPCPPSNLLLRLLDAYASRGSWTRFWEVWRIPPRFQVGRTAEMYTFLYQRLTHDQHQMRCIDALRWTVPEMFREQPAVEATEELLKSLKSCIGVADPDAAVVVDSLESFKRQRKFRLVHKLKRREFVRLLRQLVM